MGVHIYCIVARDRQPADDVAGVADATVAVAHGGRLAVWYSVHDAPPAADASSIRAHHAVVAAAMTSVFTPVPVRFGQWFATVEDAVQRIVAEEAKWLEQLERFAGRAEYGVRIDMVSGSDAARDVQRPRDSGTAYMAALARRHAEQERRRAEGEAIARRVHEALRGLVAAATVELTGTGVALAHLVARPQAGEYHAVLAEICRSRSDLSFRFTGPWPPYSFVA